MVSFTIFCKFKAFYDQCDQLCFRHRQSYFAEDMQMGGGAKEDVYSEQKRARRTQRALKSPILEFPRFWIIGRGGVVPSWPRSNIFLSNINILDQVFIFLVEIDPNKLHGMTLRPQLHDHEDILSSHFHRHDRHNPIFQSLFFGLC